MGRSLRRETANACMVDIAAMSRSRKACLARSAAAPGARARFSNSSRSRSFISPAAFSVKVMAAILLRGSGETPRSSSSTRWRIRSIRVRVLPVPAEASTAKEGWVSRTARSRSRSREITLPPSISHPECSSDQTAERQDPTISFPLFECGPSRKS